MNDVVEITYYDHVMFDRVEEKEKECLIPCICKVIGRLDKETDDSVRIVWKEETQPGHEQHPEAGGFVVVKKAIISIRYFRALKTKSGKGGA